KFKKTLDSEIGPNPGGFHRIKRAGIYKLDLSPLLSYGDGLYAFNLWMIFIRTEAVQFDVVGFFFFYFSDPLILILLLLLRLLLLLL
ncbi:hypothetical protein Tco_1098616, partial [Tanacetum coccineum]